MEQETALERASGAGAALLQELDATQIELAAARGRIVQTLSQLDQQRQMLESSNSSLVELRQRQSVIQAQLADMQEALGGQRPITRDDLDGSQMSDLVVGGLVGFFLNLLASWTFVRWPFRWRRGPQCPVCVARAASLELGE